MQAKAAYGFNSFQQGTSPMVLSEIFSPATSVSVWQREQNKVIVAYFKSISASLGMGIRSVLPVSALKTELTEMLPDALGKEQAVEDICLLSEMLTCLFDCNEVGLRLTSMTKAMCPRFHVDNIPVRLVTTYCGAGTEWLPNEAANPRKLGHAAKGASDADSGLLSDPKTIKQMNTFDVGLLKGSAWDEEHLAAIHRSCGVEQDQHRVLLTLDPI